MAQLQPYLHFSGTAAEAFTFYKKVLGGEFSAVAYYKDGPPNEAITPEEGHWIMNIALPIGEHSVLMGSDRPKAYGVVERGNGFFISLAPDSKEKAEQIFNALAEGGAIHMPLADTFWNAFFGMVQDKYGIAWMINYEYKK